MHQFHLIRYFLVSPLIVLLLACGGSGGDGGGNNNTGSPTVQTYAVAGSAVKGPLANAAVRLYVLDPQAVDFKGALVAEGTTSAQAAITGVNLSTPLAPAYLLEVVADADTVDVSTGIAPLLSVLRTIVTSSQATNLTSITVTPQTTLAVELGRLSAAPGASVTDVLANIQAAAATVVSRLGFGMDANIDIFTAPAMINAGGTLNDIASYRTAIEAVTALIGMLDIQSSANPDALLLALAQDLLDDEINGMTSTQPISVLNEIANFSDVINSTTIALLEIPNTDKDGNPATHDPYTVDEVEQLLVNEAGDFGITRDMTELTSGAINIIPAPFSTDTDKDGIPNITDPDIDNDGVLNNDDAFPEDESEWSDRDGDGVGDNADAYPDNAACYATLDGNGIDCYSTALISTAITKVIADANGIVYFYVASWNTVLRFNSQAGHYLAPVSVSTGLNVMAHSMNHQRLYLGYTGGAITYVDLTSNLVEQAFSSLPLTPGGLVAVGNYLLAQDSSGAWNTHYI